MNEETLARIISQILHEIELEKNEPQQESMRIEPRVRFTSSLKANLLERYARGKIQTFRQFDGFKMDGCDDLMRPDEDGHCITGGTVEELRNTGTDLKVRIQVRPDTNANEAVVIAQKIVDYMLRCALKQGAQAFTDEVTCIIKYRKRKNSAESEEAL